MDKATIREYGRAVQFDREAEYLGFVITWNTGLWRAFKGDRKTLAQEESTNPGPRAVSCGDTLDSLRGFLDGVIAATEEE